MNKVGYVIAGLVLAVVSACSQGPQKKTDPLYEVTYTTTEWMDILSPNQFRIMRLAGTERAYTSPLDKEFGDGYYICAADSTILFTSNNKFNSGTGWPSFSGGNNLEYQWDGSATEVRCITCGSHLGHLFKDGEWTNSHNENRYCINGAALIFKSTE